LVNTWGKDPVDTLIPLIKIGDEGLVGYILDTGGSGGRTRTLYSRSGVKLREFSTEAPLINMGLGPIDYFLLAAGAVSLGKYAIGKFVAKRAAAAAAVEAVEAEAAFVVPTKTVGRHMSPAELAKMKQTGRVQEGGGGQTRVADPANLNSYRNPPKGDVYVEFDVPAHRVLPHSQGTGRIPGPNSPDARLPGRNPADFEMPPATNIRVFR
jgi:hypothetical protein